MMNTGLPSASNCLTRLAGRTRYVAPAAHAVEGVLVYGQPQAGQPRDQVGVVAQQDGDESQKANPALSQGLIRAAPSRQRASQ